MPVHITFESHSVSRNGRWFMRRMYCICCCWCWSMIMIFYTLDTNFKIHNAIAQTYLNSLIKPYKQNWSREHDEHEIIHKGQHSWILVRFYSNRVCQRDNHSWCVKQCSVILTLIAMFKVDFSSRFMPTHFPSIPAVFYFCPQCYQRTSYTFWLMFFFSVACHAYQFVVYQLQLRILSHRIRAPYITHAEPEATLFSNFLVFRFDQFQDV